MKIGYINVHIDTNTERVFVSERPYETKEEAETGIFIGQGIEKVGCFKIEYSTSEVKKINEYLLGVKFTPSDKIKGDTEGDWELQICNDMVVFFDDNLEDIWTDQETVNGWLSTGDLSPI